MELISLLHVQYCIKLSEKTKPSNQNKGSNLSLE